MAETTGAGLYDEVASPFCGLACDDLLIKADGNNIQVMENGDAITIAGFETPVTDLTPRVQGKEATLAEAVQHSAKYINNSQQTLIGGLGTDLNGARAAMALADKARASVDSAYSDAAFKNILVLQDSGYMTTTLTEVKNRVDLLVVVGSDIESAFPRFFERIIWPEQNMFGQDVATREIVYLGQTPSGEASTSPSGRKAQMIACEQTDLPEVLSVLRALVKSKQVQAESVAGIKVATLKTLAEELNAAKYAVMCWSGSQMQMDHAELTIQQLCEMIKEINQTTRCNALPLGGKEGDVTVNAVSSWQSGYPMRTNFHHGYPEYDPYLNNGNRMLAEAEADCLVWVSAFNTKLTPPASDAKTIVIGRSGMIFEREPEVFIPVGVPGIDHTGCTFRSDSVVSVPLKKLRDSGLPSAFEILTAVEQAL